MTTTTDLIRSESLQQVTTTLTELQTRRRDLVVPMSVLRLDDDGETMHVPERDVELDLEGVTERITDHDLVVADLAHDQIADRLSIPRRYYRLMTGDHADLRATNVNHWFAADSRSVMLRTYTNPDGGPGLLRAVLSDRYAIIDNLDVTMSVLDGIVRAGVDPGDVNITGDLTDRGRLRLRVTSEAIGTNVADLLGDYRSPFNGRPASELPMLWAGVEVTNSETGGGAFNITPRVVLQVCTNGMTQTKDVERSIHLGSRLEEGVVRWSHETAVRTLELMSSRARDAVATFLSTEYVEQVANRLRAVGDVPVPPSVAVEVATANLSLTEGEQSELLALFGASGQRTAMGVGHAVTALAQSAGSDRSAELEAAFFDIVQGAALAVSA